MDQGFSGDCSDSPNRRTFLNSAAAGLAVGATVAASGPGTAGAADDPVADPVLPTRKLGKTGVDVSILNLGTWQSTGLDRLLRFAYASGIRYYDAAKSYGSEPGIKRWFEAFPDVRKQLFLVTKDHPTQPGDLEKAVDDRLKALGTDYLDLFFIHALGDSSPQAGLDIPKDKEWAKAIDKVKSKGKIKFFGFSSHHERRAEFLQAAAEGGFIDALMVQYTPWLDKESALNKALDACHAKGIGLISMKQVAGQFNPGGGQGPAILEEVVKRVPMLKDLKLTPFQGLLHAIWSDERISTACVSMRNTDHIRENVDAARRYTGPLKEADIRSLRDAALAAGPTLCADCDGRCSRAAGTDARLGDLTRYLTYFEHHGYRGEARRFYGELNDNERNWKDADLIAAQKACPNGLNFSKLLPRVDEHLA